MKKFIKLLILCNLVSWSCCANVFIDIKIRTGDSLTVKYYKPFKDFANEDLGTLYGTGIAGRFSLTFNISQPTFIKLIFNNTIVELLCEPNDSLVLKVRNPLLYKNDWLEIEGENSRGHSYYNFVFNKVRVDKFYKMREVFELNYDHEIDFLMDKIRNEISRQMVWVDSLLSRKEISVQFANFMKTQISCTLAWEVGEQCNKYFEIRDPLSIKSSTIKRKLFEAYNPLDDRLRTSLAKSYYYTYFSEMYKTTNNPDTSKIIVDDTPFYSLAPIDLQGYLWGSSLMAHHLYDPDKEGNCKSFKKYASKFKEAPFVEFFESSDICVKVHKSDVKIISPFDSDIFTFLKFNFFGKKVFIDLWATWCAPCKVEFKSYDSAFNKFMKDNKIELVFISIDKWERRELWLKEVNTLNLNGYHMLSQVNLQTSIKTVIYDDGEVVIPRYILVDENGKILSLDFIRPSNELFKAEIIRFLGK